MSGNPHFPPSRKGWRVKPGCHTNPTVGHGASLAETVDLVCVFAELLGWHENCLLLPARRTRASRTRLAGRFFIRDLGGKTVRDRRYSRLVWAWALGVLVGCGPGARSQHVVASFALTSDVTGALQQELCLNTRGVDQCRPYPNPLACQRIEVEILADGRSVGQCVWADGRSVSVTGLGNGLPITCGIVDETGCVACGDVYGGQLVDSCGDRQIVFVPHISAIREQIQQLVQPARPRGSSSATFPSTGSSATVPFTVPRGQGSATCAEQAQEAFTAAMADLLQSEGLGYSYVPSSVALGGDTAGAHGVLNIPVSAGASVCDETPRQQMFTYRHVELFAPCDNSARAEGKCYCFDHQGRSTCRCARFVARVLTQACQSRPADCDEGTWGSDLLPLYADASQWLTQQVGQLPIELSQGGAPDTQRIACLYSPLVIDRAGDGVRTTTPDDGVSFDLLGRGASSRTAWLNSSDDAFVALDRNYNGRIDGGHELFGESALAGLRGTDGFAALSVLDRPEDGGNGDGWITADDARFGELLIWTDVNHDGVSQAEELSPLAATEVTALGVSPWRRDTGLDAQGNDLGTRGVFRRSDNRLGSLVDVYFRAVE